MLGELRPVLSRADHRRLRLLVESGNVPRSGRDSLLDFLSLGVIAEEDAAIADRVGLYQGVTLVSKAGSDEQLKLTIVLPGERSARSGRVSVLTDQALAVLGRRCGEEVIWAEPPGVRRMWIAAIAKFDSGAETDQAGFG